MSNLLYEKFVRKPFVVEAIEITTENIEELSEFIGKLKHKDNGDPYIQVDKRLVPNIYKVQVGFWMTRMNDNIRCYAPKIFVDQFVGHTDELQTWIDFLDSDDNGDDVVGEDVVSQPEVGEYGRILEVPQPADVADDQTPAPSDVADGQS